MGGVGPDRLYYARIAKVDLFVTSHVATRLYEATPDEPAA